MPKPNLSIATPPAVKKATPVLEDEDIDIASDSTLSSESDLSESEGDYRNALERLYVVSCSTGC